MPELPEVETIKRELEQKVLNKKIIKTEILLPKVIKTSKAEFKKDVEGATIKNISRRAKLLIFELSNKNYFVVHLKLTGQLLLVEKDIKPSNYTRAIFYLSDSKKLFFDDLRKFGYIKFANQEGLKKILEKEGFGPEPLDRGFTMDVFKKLLKSKPRAKIKPLLMNQTFIAGIGNVYAQEACFYAKIMPGRKVETLTNHEIKNLYDGLKKILAAAIQKKGSSVNTYIDIYGKKGGYVPLLKVYGRKNKPCFRCKSKVQMMKLAGRGTYFCPKCQK
jgi:formamidopyrimidine-DNA glycosylase